MLQSFTWMMIVKRVPLLTTSYRSCEIPKEEDMLKKLVVPLQ